ALVDEPVGLDDLERKGRRDQDLREQRVRIERDRGDELVERIRVQQSFGRGLLGRLLDGGRFDDGRRRGLVDIGGRPRGGPWLLRRYRREIVAAGERRNDR